MTDSDPARTDTFDRRTSPSAVFVCGECGEIACRVTLVWPGQNEQQPASETTWEPQTGGFDPAEWFPTSASLVLDGGPVSMSRAPVPAESVARALGLGDPAALYAIDPEYASFWCPGCRASYCGAHFRTEQVFDEGFYDCTYGTCPAGHRRMLDD